MAGREGSGFLLQLLALGLSLVAGAALAMPPGSRIPLECRLGDGPWRECVMEIEQIGGHWWLLIDGKRFEFRHDGSGTVRMKGLNPGWRSVTTSWQEDASLCWDGVCAKGEIPLD
jgi:hypothetical protein